MTNFLAGWPGPSRLPLEGRGKQGKEAALRRTQGKPHSKLATGWVEIEEGSLDCVTRRATRRREEKESGHSARDDRLAGEKWRSIEEGEDVIWFFCSPLLCETWRAGAEV